MVQITLLKQEKVAAFTDIDAHLSMLPEDAFSVDTKPHGHGDVHQLIHASGLGKRWLTAGSRVL